MRILLEASKSAKLHVQESAAVQPPVTEFLPYLQSPWLGLGVGAKRVRGKAAQAIKLANLNAKALSSNEGFQHSGTLIQTPNSKALIARAPTKRTAIFWAPQSSTRHSRRSEGPLVQTN